MSRSSLNVRPLAVIGCEVVGLVDQARGMLLELGADSQGNYAV